MPGSVLLRDVSNALVSSVLQGLTPLFKNGTHGDRSFIPQSSDDLNGREFPSGRCYSHPEIVLDGGEFAVETLGASVGSIREFPSGRGGASFDLGS